MTFARGGERCQRKHSQEIGCFFLIPNAPSRPSAHEAVQNGKVSVTFRYFALLHCANGSYTNVKMASYLANAGSFLSMAHIAANRKYFLEFLRSVIITDCAFQIKCDQISTLKTGSD